MDDEDLDLLLALADEAEEEDLALANHSSRTSLRPSGKAGQPQASHPAGRSGAAAPPALLRSQSLPRATHMSAPSPAAQAPPQPTTRQPVRQVADGYTDSISGFRVSKPVIGSLVLKERLTDDCVYISLKDISPSRDLAGRWATIAVLVSKVQATGRDGSSYSRWTLSDLAGKQITLFLWRKAASEHYKEPEGSLLLLWSPQVRRDEGGGGGGYSLHIDKPEMLQRPGMSTDFGLCRGTRKDGNRCTIPINKSSCEYCPYHAQAALRALSSNRADMAGANLLQRQLLPQARAAQKHLAVTTGKPLSGIISLIARPPPPKLLPGGSGGGAGVSRAAGTGRGFAPAAAADTGAYGVSADYEGSGGVGSGAGTGSGGGKRSYGAQLLANLQERQAGTEDAGGPAAKRRRSSADAGDEKSGPSVSAAKARAIAAARAAGQLGKQPGGAAAAQRVQPAAAPGSVGGAARRPPSLSGTRFSMPPPLPAELASLLTPPASNGGRKVSAAEAGGAASGTNRKGPVSGRGIEDAQRPTARASGIESANADGGDGAEEEDLIIVELEAKDDVPPNVAAEPEVEDPVPRFGKGRSACGAQPGPEFEHGAGGTADLVDDNDEGAHVASPDEHRQRQQQVEGDACDGAAGPSWTAGRSASEADAAARGVGSEKALNGEGCGLDELLELFPELQDRDEPVQAQQQDSDQHQPGGAAAVGRMQPSQKQVQSPSNMMAVGQTGEANVDRGARAAAAACGPNAIGDGSGGIRAGTGMPAAVATGLLPRVAGLGIAPSALKAAARKQQAVAAKVHAEKLALLGMKPPPSTVLSAPSKPLCAANMVGGQTRAAEAAAAAALAAAKGLPMPRSGARTAAAQAAAAAGATVTTGPAPSSALAAAFGSLVQKLPEAEGPSRYSELSEEAADEAMLSMLEGLEARDALVKQLDSITHLKVTAWHCVECNRLSEFMDKQCRAEGHTLNKATTLKRFWTCDHCNARITTLGVRFPASRCSRYVVIPEVHVPKPRIWHMSCGTRHLCMCVCICVTSSEWPCVTMGHVYFRGGIAHTSVRGRKEQRGFGCYGDGGTRACAWAARSCGVVSNG
ncbi:hypothetical protein VaNZ11_011461 [Volvox africanus]|uniref:Protein MCM10 homolog n=1 Tax=Volvox africanus TaxID=51714 RepID=A0ABQ5SBF9_9CHLO|nr:hypothetical protein VaNZ11_011461 [Volvox africanus]